MSDLPYDDEFDGFDGGIEFDPATGEYRSSLLSGGEATDTLPGAAGGQTQTQAPSPMAPRVSAGGRAEAMLRQLIETGAQGRTMPSNAADLAMAQTRVASILSKALKGMDGTSGLERVGSAALQTLAGQGRVSFPQAMAAMEQQDLGRAYNIANALSGLAKAQGAGAMTPQQMLNYVQRVQESEDRNIRTFDSQLSNEVGAIARGAANPGAVIAAFRNGLTNAGYDRAQTLEQRREIANRVLQSVASEPFARPRRGAGESVATPDRGGIVIDENDNVTQRKLWVPSKGEPLTDIEKKMNLALRSGNTSEYDRLYFDNQATLASKAVRDQLGTEGVKSLGKVRDAHRTAVSAFDLFSQIEGNLDRNSNVYGVAGNMASFLGGVAGFLGQMKNQVGNILNSTVAAGGPESEGARRAQAALNNPESSDFVSTALNRATSSPIIRALIANGADADVLKANILSLAYVNAAANDPSGRFSDKDVAAGIGQAAAQATNPESMRRAIGELRTRYTSNMNALLRSAPVFSEREVSWSPQLNVGAQVDQILRPVRRRGAAAAPAPAPAPAPATPPPPVPAPDTGNPPRVTSRAEYEALPSGSQYFHPNDPPGSPPRTKR